MAVPTPQTPFKNLFRKIFKPTGFSKGYNFILWVIFGGALFGFALARLMYLDFSSHFCAVGPDGNTIDGAPGECYYYNNFSRYRIGILLHLAGVLPASILAVFQFMPVIRYRWIAIHRVSGYVSMLFYLVGYAGVLMIARRSFGGGLDVQAWCYFAGLSVVACFALSLYNIKKLQIEQHRAWMLRGWFYAGSIITCRLIMVIVAIAASDQDYYIVWSCAKIASTLPDKSRLVPDYPLCASYADGSNLEQVSPVHASMGGGSLANVGAALNLSFGAALWLAFNLHALGVEIYLHLTPREAERLRAVSYKRQLLAGMRDPGSSGLTADRLGDAQNWDALRKKTSNGPAKDTTLVQPNRLDNSGP